MARDAESVIPDFVEDTIKATLIHFSGTARKKEFRQIYEQNEEEYSNLVGYKICWFELLPDYLVQYFERQSFGNELLNYRTSCQNIYDMLQSPKFILYLTFLNWVLQLLAAMNLTLQKENSDLYNAYCSLEQPLNEDSMLESFISPSNLSISSAKVTEMLRECEEQHYLPEMEIAQIKATFIEYAKKLEQAFKARVPEKDLVKCMLYSDLCNQKPLLSEIQKLSAKFTKHIDSSKVEMQYTLYCEDDAVKTLFNSDHCGSNVIKLWCLLFKSSESEYSDLARLSLLLLTLSPDTCCCERGFSCMNSIKTFTRNRLENCQVDGFLGISTSTTSTKDFSVAVAARYIQKH